MPVNRKKLGWAVPVVVVALAVGLAFDYGMALIGEPRAVWLWRDILGVLPN